MTTRRTCFGRATASSAAISDPAWWPDFFGDLPDFDTEEGKTAVRKWLRKDGDAIAAYLTDLVTALEALPEWTTAAMVSPRRLLAT